METININGLSDLDRLISEQFNLPLQPYSTDLRVALELSIWAFENMEQPHFEIFYSGAAQPEQPFLASFEPDAWDSGETPPIAVCKSALRYLKKIRVVLI